MPAQAVHSSLQLIGPAIPRKALAAGFLNVLFCPRISYTGVACSVEVVSLQTPCVSLSFVLCLSLPAYTPFSSRPQSSTIHPLPLLGGLLILWRLNAHSLGSWLRPPLLCWRPPPSAGLQARVRALWILVRGQPQGLGAGLEAGMGGSGKFPGLTGGCLHRRPWLLPLRYQGLRWKPTS